MLKNLPPELLLAIFALVLINDSPTWTMRTRLIHVCARWRAIVLSHTAFWQRLSLRPSGSVKNRPRMTDLDFERAASCCGLDVSIGWEAIHVPMDVTGSIDKDSDWDAVWANHHAAISAYVLHALDMDVQARTQILRFGKMSRFLLDSITKADTDFSGLKGLQQLYFEPGWFVSAFLRQQALSMMHHILDAAVAVEVVTLSSLTIHDRIFIPSLRRLRLKNCELAIRMGLPSLLSGLSGVEELELLERDPATPMSANEERNEPINLPNLHTLALSPPFDMQDAQFLQQLRSPALRHIALSTVLEDAADFSMSQVQPAMPDIPNILAAIKEQGWNLEWLRLNDAEQL